MPSNYDEPKTRREKKGRDKHSPNSVYTGKHVREQERLAEKRQQRSTKENGKQKEEIKTVTNKDKHA
jgi:hypothetical protein